MAVAAYVGNRGNRLTRFFDANQASAGGAAPLAERRPFTNFGTIQFMDSGGTSNYHSLQTRLERRFANGLSFLHSFTYGRGLESATSWAEGLGGPDLAPQDAYNYRNEYGPAASMVKFNSIMNFVYALPVGHGKSFLRGANRFTEAVLGGWQISSLHNWRSGFPITISSNQCGPNCQLGDRQQRADIVPGLGAALDSPSAAAWFNTRAFAPAVGPYGSVGKGTLYGPNLQRWDFNFAKNFSLTEKMYIQFRSEWFNAFNQVNYDTPDRNASSSSFGRIATAQEGRNLQFALKLYF